MIRRDDIRIVEPSDGPSAVTFKDSDLPILEWVDGWALFYLDAKRRVRDHLVPGTIYDLDLAVHYARAWLDRAPQQQVTEAVQRLRIEA